MSTTQRKELKQLFTQITGTKDPTAQKYLKATNWDLAQALDTYYQTHPSQMKSYSSKTLAISRIFESYKDPHEDAILAEGMEQYCADLQVDPTDVSMLILAWHLGAEQMCEFKWKGFVEGWQGLGCDTLDKMRIRISKMKAELDDPVQFKKIYQFAFKFGLTSGQRTLGVDVAVGLWELLLPGKFSLLELWLAFIQDEYKKAISKDAWNVLLDFINTVDPDFSDYDPSGAWPIVFDEFVDYVKRSRS